MRQVKQWLWLVGAPTLIASCALQAGDPGTEKTGKEVQDLDLTVGTRVTVEAVLTFPATVFAENPQTLIEAKDFHGYEFDGLAGGVVTITTRTNGSCGNLDTVLHLFKPEDDAGNRGSNIALNDDAFLSNQCFLDSQIRSFRLPVTGTYLLVVTSFLQLGSSNNAGHYQLTLACNNGACTPAGTSTFQNTKIAQADVDRGVFTPEDLFEIGDFSFEVGFQLVDGLGNSLANAPGAGGGAAGRPNFRQIPNNVHFAGFGAPEAQSCVTCHNEGGDDGAGDTNHNIFQIGDGINRNSGVPRNPPTVLGNGLRQRVGEEMTTDLKGQLTTGLTNARNSGANQTVTLASKGIGFGSVVARPDQTVDFTNLRGVDTDLVVKPFGWKGREATLRRFVEGGFRVHFGLQSFPSLGVAGGAFGHCKTPNVNNFGTGADCTDPDVDGVRNEVSEGQLTAMAIYMGLRETPVRVPAVNATAQSRAAAGETVFNNIGCATCHRRNMTLNSPIHFEASDTTGAGKGIRINLAVDNHDPKPAVAANGSMTIEVFSDFKRHDVGAALADVKAFNQIGANQFITTPLWGVADSAPYLHDGRAPTLNDAIRLHAGEAQTVRDRYVALSADDQSKVQEFLLTLGRIEDVGRARVDLGNFDIFQTQAANDFFIPAGTTVPHDGFLIISRNSNKTDFQNFYGRTLGSNVVFINSAATGQSFPRVNGSETYTLFDSQFVIMDGPTIPEPTAGGQTFSRRNCSTKAGDVNSWSRVTSSIAAASPGSGLLTTSQGFVCISEVADVPAGASTNFEYIELKVE